MFYFKLLFQAQRFIVTLFSIVYINNIQTVYKIQCGLEDYILTIGHERTEFIAYC